MSIFFKEYKISFIKYIEPFLIKHGSQFASRSINGLDILYKNHLFHFLLNFNLTGCFSPVLQTPITSLHFFFNINLIASSINFLMVQRMATLTVVISDPFNFLITFHSVSKTLLMLFYLLLIVLV